MQTYMAGGGAGGGAAAGGGGGGDAQCGVGCGADAGGAGNASAGADARCGVDADDATVMSHTGQGGGDYKMKTYYEYVGAGKGDHDAIKVPSNVSGNYCSVYVTICMILPVLLLLLHALSSQGVKPHPTLPPPTAPPPVAPTLPPQGTCTFWGDPHYWTFDDKMHVHEEDQYANHDYWIVKTPTIWIQGRYRPTEWLKKRGNHRACMHGVGFGGPFMESNKFIVEALNGQITYNNLPVLTSFPSTFKQGPVTATYQSSGMPNDPRMGKMALHILSITLPKGVNVQIDRWKEHIDGHIKIPPAEAAGITGSCGNYNGNANDDVSQSKDKLGEHNGLMTHRVQPSERIMPAPQYVPSAQSGLLVGNGAAFNE